MAQGHDTTEVHLDPCLDPLDVGPSVILGAMMERIVALEGQRIPATRIRLHSSLDPLDHGLEEAIRQIGERLNLLWDAAKVNPETEPMVAPPRTDQRSLNADRLVRAYDVLSDKDVRVKLTCEGRRPSDAQEIYIDLPAEKM